MSDIAERAGASKETLYAWFGSREGLTEALIRANADASAARVTAALDQASTDPFGVRETLTGYAVGLLTLLTGRASVALNRAAVGSPSLARTLLAAGRYRIGPIVEQYLGMLDAGGAISAPDTGTAYRMLYGLVVQDTQIRVLLGEPAPGQREIARRAADAVDAFLRLVARGC